MAAITHSESSTTVDTERREGIMFRKFINLWPLWLTIAGGVVAGIRFYYTVGDLSRDQAAWKTSSESRREHLRDEMEAIRTRLTKLETQAENRRAP